MAARLTWSTSALDDLEAIAQFIGRDSPYHARRVIDEAFSLAEAAAEQPLIGRVVPELANTTVRERFFYSYRMLYRVGDAGVEILAIVHGRRLLQP